MPNLILSRKSGESIVIGEHGDIVVTVQSVRGGTVDL
ncbi:MAG: carbon storage regulator, partial [Gammaproteobacteria bacterium]|nr:carbon storage regulator [Gammaproteobacteria bacterium]